MGKSETSPWDEAGIERLVAPYLGDLAQPTSLSALRYDLNAGVPDRASLPAAEIAEATARALRDDPAGALTYGGAQGYEPLRAWIAERHCSEGLAVGPEHVTLCSGSAHAIDNIAAAFLGAGDVAVVGAPTYPGAIRAFRARGARLIDVPQDAQGLRPDALREALARREGPPPKLLYLIPTYDNPSGSTMPLDRREELLRIAEEHSLLIVEDDAYAGLDLDGPPPPSLFSLARGRGVMYVGTSSKTIATGLRLGWTVAAPEVVRRLVFARLDNGASPFVHRTVLEYLRAGGGGDYEAHVERLRAIYRERRDAAVESAREALDGFATFDPPGGGFYLWLHLGERLDAVAFGREAAARGVAVTPGPLYFANGGGERNVRLAFPAQPPGELRNAIAILGEAAAAAATS